MSAQAVESAPLTIAVVKPCCIGDCVMALPAIESLANAFPHAHIHAFAGRHSAPVFRASSFVSRVYISPDQLTASRVPGMAWNLRTAGHDWIVVLDRSRWLTAAARSAAPARLVTLPKRVSGPRHEIDMYLDAIASAGVKITTTIPRVELDEQSREAADQALEGIDGPFVVLHPGGAENPGATMFDKRWPPESHAQIARYLTSIGFTIVLTGGRSDIEVCRSVASMASDATVLNLSGQLGLMESVAVIRRAALYVGTDTGLSHLAAAVGTPAAVIFGPTNPERYAPRGKHVRVLAPAASHLLPDADLRKTASASNWPSTADVSVEDVTSAIEQLLETENVDQ